MGHWLSQQHDEQSGVQSLKFVETWKLDHVQMREDNKLVVSNRFSLSEYGTIGISCSETPSLSVIYPETDKSPTVLSHDKFYRSATFMKLNGKEYLAAACDDDGCLYLWDIESKMSKKVFDPELSREQRPRGMNIFKINDYTVGFGEMQASPDGSRRVFILKMNKEELTLSSTIRTFTPDNIWDICYTEVEGGTPCLLLCIPDSGIMAVEMVGGTTRWEAGKEQMGDDFFPWSICTDDENKIYVADFGQRKIHLLSTTDGVVLKQFDGRNFGISDLFTVRFHDLHLYVEHWIRESKYAISKFEESEER